MPKTNVTRKNCIKLWRFEDAPHEFKQLHGHPGDEDWVLYCPANAVDLYWPLDLDYAIKGTGERYISQFGLIDRYVLENGDVVIIFSHA